MKTDRSRCPAGGGLSALPEMKEEITQMKRKTTVLLLAVLLLALTACGEDSADKVQDPDPAVTTLTYATLSAGNKTRTAINLFNKLNPDIHIELKDYSTYGEDGSAYRGLEKLLSEMTAGQIPDIIDIGSGDWAARVPYTQLIEKGYLEDLWPYIENDPDLGRESLMEAPLKAAEVNGGLYMVFGSVWINTLLAPERLVGDRYSWTREEMMELYAGMPENVTILDSYTTKDQMFYLQANMDDYIDWETRQCSFDSDGFRSLLEFSNSFPLEVERPSPEVLRDEQYQHIKSGLQMAETMQLFNFQTFPEREYIWGEKLSFIGFPTADGSIGSQFYPYRESLAMSSSCQNKEAAWKFMREVLLPDYDFTPEDVLKTERAERQYLNIELVGFPVNRADFEVLMAYNMSAPYDMSM